MLEQRIQTGRYHGAAVGDCPSGSETGLSVYRITAISTNDKGTIRAIRDTHATSMGADLVFINSLRIVDPSLRSCCLVFHTSSASEGQGMRDPGILVSDHWINMLYA